MQEYCGGNTKATPGRPLHHPVFIEQLNTYCWITTVAAKRAGFSATRSPAISGPLKNHQKMTGVLPSY
jgi:hypothetical protein